MTILLSGGGTGGHITPILAVAHELKKQSPTCRIVYVGERNGKFASMLQGNRDIDKIYSIFAGKFRRYHGESWLKQIFDIKSLILNTRDFGYFLIGCLQGIGLVSKIKPDAVLLKGGFVGVPIGLSAALLRKQIITHDSDALPGLANRMVSRWAKYHATGMPASFYKYDQSSVKHVGVLVSADYQPVSETQALSMKDKIGLKVENQLLFVTGGSLGSRRLNTEFSRIVPDLLKRHPNLHIVHQVGRGNESLYPEPKDKRLQVMALVDSMHVYSGAADVIVTRAGATTLAEFGVQGKACVVVPNPLLTGGHQLINAQHLIDQQAVLAVSEETFNKGTSALEQAIESLLTEPKKRAMLSKKLRQVTIPDATQRLAKLIIETAKTGRP